MSVKNPIISGFFPDPSCIKVGSSFYVANSSFQFFPGIPIHESKDLVNWTHIGSLVPSSVEPIETHRS
jgi:beta-xylosidase